MINKVTFSNYNQSFKANFSKDDKTKEVLSTLASKSPVETYLAIKNIKKIDTNDSISLKMDIGSEPDFLEEDGCSWFNQYFVKNNNTNQEAYFEEGGYNTFPKLLCEIILGKDSVRYNKLFSKKLSGNKKINDISKLTNNAEAELARITKTEKLNNNLNLIDSEINKYQKEKEEINKKIDDLNKTKDDLKDKKKNIYKNYVKSLIDNDDI